jgi:hypothetical protein
MASPPNMVPLLIPVRTGLKVNGAQPRPEPPTASPDSCPTPEWSTPSGSPSAVATQNAVWRASQIPETG